MTSPASFRPHEKVKHPDDFRRAFERRRSVSDSVLIVHGIENGRDYARLGIAVPRKRVRAASARNRLKRVIREAFRLSKSEIPVGIDLIVLPRDPGLTFEAARKSLPILTRDLARRLRLPTPAPVTKAVP
jgi:ribonuclease P protein component